MKFSIHFLIKQWSESEYFYLTEMSTEYSLSCFTLAHFWYPKTIRLDQNHTNLQTVAKSPQINEWTKFKSFLHSYICSNVCCEWILVYVLCSMFIIHLLNRVITIQKYYQFVLFYFDSVAKHWTYRSTYISEYDQHTLTPIKEFRDI